MAQHFECPDLTAIIKDFALICHSEWTHANTAYCQLIHIIIIKKKRLQKVTIHHFLKRNCNRNYVQYHLNSKQLHHSSEVVF